VLVYPLVDAHSGRTGSYRTYGEGHFLTHRDIDWFLDAYAGDADRSDPRLSPALAGDLGGLAPATVVTAECDPLVDEGAAYARALAAAGVPTEYTCFAGQVHPFVLLGSMVDDAHEARRLIGRRLADAFGTRPAGTEPAGTASTGS
jgi:acetyl esterase